MFYPVTSLKKGGRFYICWVADSWPHQFEAMSSRQIASQDIPSICDDLMEVIKQESGRPSQRFSLRLSSQLIRGVARLYQKKASLLMRDVCMHGAHAMNKIKKKYKWTDHVSREIRVPRPVPRLELEEQEDEEGVERLLQRNGQMIARIEDITLREPTLAENRAINDGFGELTTEPAIEMMLAPNSSAQVSALEHPLSPNRSALVAQTSALVPQTSTKMLRPSDIDVSVFDKSTGENLKAPGVVEREIPDITDIPIPVMPPEIPQQEEQRRADQVLDGFEKIILEEIGEQDLETRQPVRKQKSLQIDEQTKIPANVIRSRLEDLTVELRCQDSASDVIDIHVIVPARVLLGRPTAAGARLSTSVARPLKDSYMKLLGHAVQVPSIQHEHEPSAVRQQIDKTTEGPSAMEIPQELPQEVQEIPLIQTELASTSMLPDGTNLESVPMDISDLPTQRILIVSEMEPSTKIPSPTKRPRMSAPAAVRPRLSEKENIADNQQTREDRLSSQLKDAGLFDIIEPEREKEQEVQRQRSETPLGSLDRTKVSLGDSVSTTDSQKLLCNEWGTRGTMTKIQQCINQNIRPITVPTLVSRGPTLGRTRFAMAKCFTSILKLKHHGFITVIKDPTTLEIRDIEFGPVVVI